MALDPLPTFAIGVDGFEALTFGGLPRFRCTLVRGASGTGKTLFALQSLVSGAREGDQGIFVSLEESRQALLENTRSLGWDLDAWVRQGEILLLDFSPEPTEEVIEVGDYDLSGLVGRVAAAVRQTGATRVAFDSIGSLFLDEMRIGVVRREMSRLATGVRDLGVDLIMTAEQTGDDALNGQLGVEDYIADNVIVLRNTLQDGTRRRTIELLKVRGSTHQRGEVPFTIDPVTAISIFPHSAIEDLEAP